LILLEVDPPVGVITLNRPAVLNALSPAVIAEVTAALGELERDDSVRAVVLTGGPKVFAAGADIGDMAERGPVEQLARDQTGRWAGITAFTKPLIAAVNGYALGGGCEMALMCDLVIAGDSARFGQPEINLGIIAGAGGTQRWPRTAGKYVAMEVNLGGQPVAAQHAYQLGVVNKVVPAEMTIEAAKGVAWIRLNRPEKLNPIGVLARQQLDAALKEVERDESVRCVVLIGSGRGFSAGADVREMGSAEGGMRSSEDVGRVLREQYAPMLQRIRSMPKPVICGLNGVAAGIGAS